MPPEPTPILIVDDDEGIRDALGEMLGDEGYPVATAANGEEAMAWLRRERPRSCIVLLDLMMPVMDGDEFLRLKRSDPELAGLPVIIVTASGRPVDPKPGIRAYIQKPIEMPLLMAAIEACAG